MAFTSRRVDDVFKPRENSAKTITQCFKIYFVLLNVFFLIDLGCIRIKSRKIRSSVKVLQILLASYISVLGVMIYYNTNTLFNAAWKSFFVFIFYANVIKFSMFRNSFYYFIAYFNKLDVLLKGKHSQSFLFISTIIMVMFRINSPMFRYVSWWEIIVHPFIVFQIDLLKITYIFIYFTVYIRLRKLTCIVKSCTNIKYSQSTYISFLDASENVIGDFDFSVSWIIYFYNLIPLLFEIVIIVAPAIMGCLMISESETIKLILEERLHYEQGFSAKHLEDIQYFISYINARPFKFSIYKSIDMDHMLPLTIANIFFKYVIVVLQINHLF